MPTLGAAGHLKLAYAFTTTPTPLRASAKGMDPNRANLRVIVSNPLPTAVEVSKITIEIPLGHDISRDLSNNTSLPSPIYDMTGPWTITTENETITIAPADADSGQVIGPIMFSLADIVVNQTPGTVPLTITEFSPSDAKIEDRLSHALVKEPSGDLVKSFAATPASVTKLEQPVTLRWTCSELGKHNVFGLRIANLQATAAARPAVVSATPFKSCVADGDCYTWHDGENGVVIPAVYQTTTFALDVVQVDGEGHRTVVDILTATVEVTVPSISQNSYVESALGGRVLVLHWLALHAKSCSVEIDGVVIDSTAPTDTYAHGYRIVPPTTDGERLISVVAHAQSGPAQATFTFPPQRITPMTRLDLAEPGSSVISQDGTLALVANGYDSGDQHRNATFKSTITVIDLGPRKAEPATVFVPGVPLPVETIPGVRIQVATVPGSSLALVSTWDGMIRAMDVPGRQLEPVPIPVAFAETRSFAITPDGKTAVVVGASTITLIDIPGRKVEATIRYEQGLRSIAITPDGTLGFMSTMGETVRVIDLAKRALEPTPITVGGLPDSIAITPDGALALVAKGGHNAVSVIDIATRTVEARTIPTGEGPRAMVISPSGAFALTANYGKSVTIIDIARRTSTTLPWEAPVSSVAISPDGRTAVVVAEPTDKWVSDIGSVTVL